MIVLLVNKSFSAFIRTAIICFLFVNQNICAQHRPPEAGKENLQLIWSDEFETDGAPNPQNWNFEYGFVRNQELQWYQPQNARCKNGLLIIEAKRERIENPNYNSLSQDWRMSRQYAQYSSACLITKNLHEWPVYGYYEIRGRIDIAKGSWPAIWLLGKDKSWPDCGEIDIMELYRIDDVPCLLANAAWGSGQRHVASWNTSVKKLTDFMENDPDWSKKFHTWSMNWDEQAISIFLDGKLMNKIDLSEVRNPDHKNPFTGDNTFYLLLNLAIGSNGGDPDGSDFPLRFEVDYVRVYKYQ